MIRVVAETLPEVPLIVIGALLPVAAVELGVSVKVVAPLVVTLVGLNEAVTPVGSPETEKLTAPANPLAGVSVIASVADTPPEQKANTQVGGITVTLAGFGVKLMLGALTGGATTSVIWVV